MNHTFTFGSFYFQVHEFTSNIEDFIDDSIESIVYEDEEHVETEGAILGKDIHEVFPHDELYVRIFIRHTILLKFCKSSVIVTYIQSFFSMITKMILTMKMKITIVRTKVMPPTTWSLSVRNH